MHLECYEGKRNSEWKIEKPLGFWQFGENLLEQMLAYYPAHRLYPRDQNMRMFTQQRTRICTEPRLNRLAHVDVDDLLVLRVLK